MEKKTKTRDGQTSCRLGHQDMTTLERFKKKYHFPSVAYVVAWMTTNFKSGEDKGFTLFEIEKIINTTRSNKKRQKNLDNKEKINE